uniref:Phospholipid/glycerol acyltransferase domain-containing protein n=1 Tax=Strigamia maritima TaxID=126957 RepID=T1JP97_STRMM
MIIPTCLVVYMYLNWPLCFVYDKIFTCLQGFGFFKHVNRWDLFMTLICKMWRVISRVWHGYETRGMENIPKEGPAVFVFYHGTISMDIYYFVKAVNLDKGRLARAVFHKQLTKLPGFHLMIKVARGLVGTKENCLEALRNGNYIVIAPGGDMEPLHSDETNYKLVWRNRIGFAKIAIEAQVPLIPVFTENIQELFRTPKFLRSLFLLIDKYLHIPLVPAYGGFPVKLISHVGKPIYPEPHLTAEQLAKKLFRKSNKLVPYLSLAFYSATLYGGLIAFYYLHVMKSLFRNGYSRLDVEETRDWIIKWMTFFGKVWHDHEITGLENIPNEPVLYVLYHGPIPVDGYYLYAKLTSVKKRTVCAVVNKNHFKLTCLTGVFKSIRAGAWSREQCVEILQTGSDLCLLPGGKYESRMSDRNYKLEWGERKGFAKVALAAKVPIVPVFTRNIQEAFWTPWYAKPFTKGRFSKRKQYLNVMCGGLPVKLVTVIGEPIWPDEGTNFEDLAALTKKAVQQLIDQNQIVPGNKWRALKERFSKNIDEKEEFCLDKELMIQEKINTNGSVPEEIVLLA